MKAHCTICGFHRDIESSEPVGNGTHRVELCAPYLDKTQLEIADIAKRFGVWGHEIWTCYQGGTEPCGVCPACRKLEALGL